MTRHKSKGLKALAAVNLKKSETGAHEVFRKFGQSLPVKISKVDLPTKPRFPYVRFSDWLTYLVEHDEMQHLTGTANLSDMQRSLSVFWERYRCCHPDHEVYHRDIPCEMVIPVAWHGDEGRGHKKKQIMILSTHGVLGKGSRGDDTSDRLRLNMLGNTFLSHFLFSVMPINLYQDSPESFFKMLEIQAEEFKTLFNHGIVIRGQRYYVACLGCKGDAPWLAKSGRFDRAFTRRPTRATARNPCQGICHQCLAGKEDWECDVPFEELGSAFPAWLNTMGVLKAFTAPSPLLEIPFDHGGNDHGEGFWKFDLFHNWHLGLGKNFISSAVCVIMELLMPMSLDETWQFLTRDFLDYCSRCHESPYHKKLSGSLFGVECSFKDCPEGGWSKGDFTRLLHRWFEDFCSRKVIGHTQDPFYLKCVAWSR